MGEERFYRSWVELRRLKPSEWLRLKNTIAKIEKAAFRDHELAQNMWELRETFRDKEAICIIAKYNNRTIGYISGRPLENYSYFVHKTKEKNMGKKNTAYIESIAVHPDYHGNAVGWRLMKSFIREAKKDKYKFVSGNFRRGPSTYLFLLEGGRKIYATKNYAQTGEKYYYCRRKL